MTIPNSQDAPNDLEARFAHLLQPIKDLAKNWNIDIASDLEEYLEQIDNIPISFDGGVTTMNFAEAALLIQGSACVYSKKVEYLYDLVKQMLGVVGSKQKKKQTDEENGETTTVQQKFPEEEDFLSLDDIAEHRNITLRNDTLDNSILVMPKTPINLLKDDGGEKGALDFPLLSRNGEVLGSRKDFKLNVCSIHPLTGALLLDMTNLAHLESSLQCRPSSTPFPAANGASEESNQASNDFPEAAAPVDEPMTDEPDVPLPPLNFSGCGDDDADVENAQEMPESMQERPRRNLRALPPRTPEPQSNPRENMWEELDGFLDLAKKSQLLKRGRKYTLPPGLNDDDSRKRKRNKRPSDVAPLTSIEEFCRDFKSSYRAKFSGILKDPPVPAFEPLYWQTQQKIKEQRNKIKKLLTQQRLSFVDEEDNEVEEAPQIVDADDHADDEEPCDPLHFEAQIDQITPSIEEFDPNEPILSSYEQLVKQYVDGYLASAQQYTQTTELTRRVSDWESKVVPKLQEEEERDAFDIHLCGTKVIDKLQVESADENAMQEQQGPIKFRDIAKDKPRYEVCRLFLATLQLANTYNVQIDVEGELTERMDSMKVTLLKTSRHCDELAEYRAPSVQQ